jgi:hypothetical protein
MLNKPIIVTTLSLDFDLYQFQIQIKSQFIIVFKQIKRVYKLIQLFIDKINAFLLILKSNTNSIIYIFLRRH